jgi:uncharacterized protein YbjQ (UPF0145 family)
MWHHAGMTPTFSEIPCPGCGTLSEPSDPAGTGWRCPNCSLGYLLRRCAACQAVSLVSAHQQQGLPWTCVWCEEQNTGFKIRSDPATATQADLAEDIVARNLVPGALSGLHDTPDAQSVLIVTTNEIPGYRITQVHGDVFGLVVLARNVFSNVGAQFRTVTGGEVGAYTRLLTDSRNQARRRMWREARSRGANAIVAMRFDCNEIGDIMSEVAAYGTAVTVEPAMTIEPAVTIESADHSTAH